MNQRSAFLIVWAVALVLAVTWPLYSPGELLWRDMAVLHHPGLTAANFGGGDLPARATPQDGLLALFGTLGSAAWLARVLIIASAAAAAVGALWLAKLAARGKGALPAVMTAMALAVINPFVIERLLQGQWTLAIAAWLLPLIVAAGLAGNRLVSWLAMFGASLTPTGAVFGLLTGVVANRGARLATAGLGVLYCLPWALPGVIAAVRGQAPGMDVAAAVSAFAPRGEAAVGTLGALLSLGGIWNVHAVPPSRETGFALFGVVLLVFIALGAARLPRSVAVPAGILAAVGMGGAIACWLAPGALTLIIETVPGAGLLRDSQKLVALAIPLYVAGVAALQPSPRWVGWAALACMVLQTPDAPDSLRVLTPTNSGVDNRLVAQIDGRDVFFPDRPTVVTIPNGVAVDPYSKAVNKVESGALSVDGAWVDLPSPRWQAAKQAWEAGDTARLEELGIGVVVDSGVIVAQTNAGPRDTPWGLVAVWLASPLLALVLALRRPGKAPARKAKKSRPRGGAKPRNGRRSAPKKK